MDRRDWLAEAYKIANGANIQIKRKHVKAAVDLAIQFKKDVESLRNTLQIVYNEAVKSRKERGLSVPEVPPELREQ